ncbi:Protein GPR108 [Daphnia magna]|uniref:Protein GPR108 n=1 Tax=Daphnia magna TaxID=35525 RepID=A0A164X9F0_9CRUS|nr:Protein GPR108 [Daphnia magna]
MYLQKTFCSNFLLFLLIVTNAWKEIVGRKHHLDLKDETRKSIPVSMFGFLQGGILNVTVSNLVISKNAQETSGLGFSLDRTLSDAANPYLDSKRDICNSGLSINEEIDQTAVARFEFDFINKLLNVRCSSKFNSIGNIITVDDPRNKRNSVAEKLSDSSLFSRSARPKRNVQNESLDVAEASNVSVTCNNLKIPLSSSDGNSFSTNFTVNIRHSEEEGMFNLYFHRCFKNNREPINITIEVTETNGDNYLSAGEMPLPMLYFIMSTVFLASGCFWVGVLCKSKREDVYKIHYLMALLVFLKSLSLAFHGVNFHFIQTEGFHIETWAVLYYITHLLKGAVLFITIVLIGTGWAFFKHILSGKDKKIFMIVVPLQVLANVAYIITEESEAGQAAHMTWNEVFILVDLLCCGAILFPVVWSIRHLQEASQTDGKAATSLRKLQLFRHFYILVVCYVYFTRIIVYLLRITVPFRYEWLDEFFFELATYIFFVMTASKFRPAVNNPYLLLTRDDDDDEVVELDRVVTQTGLTETLVQTGRHKSSAKHQSMKNGTQEENESLVSAEGSHELD